MAQNQNTMANSTLKMDSRKFLSAINDSAQARVSFFSEKVEEMGKLAGRQWQLAALRSRDLFIEDVSNGSYFVANHTKDQGRISINNIRQVEITEGEKAGLFEESCLRLVNAIEENDQSKMAAAFGRMRAQRFSGKTVPTSGMVKTRDGVVRSISVTNGFNESAKDQIVAAIVESLQDKVIVENGVVTAGYFNNGERFKLPVTKWATRKLVARKMRDAAENAYYSNGFQERIMTVANMISENKIEEAVNAIAPFLLEMEEFTLLNRRQVSTLIENSLAAKGVFNQQLCGDTATLFFKTNLKISRDKIVKEWRSVAKNAEHSILAENVQILSEAKNFEAAYNKFLHLVFEAISNRQVAAESLATTLQVLREKTPRIKESHDLSSKLMGLISRLKKPDFDDAAIYEAEDLIATIQEELAANDTLKDFDTIPGDEGLGGFGAGEQPVSLGGEKGQPIININSPLIQIGGSSGSSEDDMDGLDEPMPSEDDELDDMLGGMEEPMGAPAAPGAPPAPAAPAAPAPPAPGAPPRMESRYGRRSLNESRPAHYEMNQDDDDLSEEEDDKLEESSDPYAFSKSGKSSFIMDYGAPVIRDEADIDRVIGLMRRLAVEHNLTGSALAENLDDMARASIEAIGLRLPEARMEAAVEQVVGNFIEEAKAPFPGAAKPFGKKNDHEDESEEDHEDHEDEGDKPWEEEGVAEDQYKSPRYKAPGYGRSGMTQAKKSRVSSEGKITWLESQQDALLGRINGVNFILDHGGNNSLQPVIMSEDGFSSEIPVPARFVKSALAAAGILKGDSTSFSRWLSESIEQLRPISEDEDMALNEAMATITTSKDGSIKVELSGDVEVDMDDEDETGDMKAVDSVEIQPIDDVVDDKEDLDGDEMPDFEKDDSDEDESDEFESDEDESDEDDEEDDTEGLAEDKDITAPTDGGYLKTAKANPRDVPKHAMNKPKNLNKLEGMGPDVKKDGGAGSNPPVARKAGKK